MNVADQNRWNALPVNSCECPYGLPFYPGERVSVSLGRLGAGIWPEHSHPRLRLIFTFHNGSARIETALCGIPRGLSWPLGPNQLGVIPQELATTVGWMRSAELVVLYLDPAYFGIADPAPCGFVAERFQAIGQNDLSFGPLTQAMWRLCSRCQPPKSGVVEGVGLALASAVMTQAHGLIAPNIKQRLGLSADTVAEIAEYIDTQLVGGRISARDLARHVSLSPDHFARRFKITARMSPMQFVLNRRVEKARELLATGKYNVTEAAAKVGFYDLSHLNRCFRKFLGCPPKTFKNAMATESYQ